MANKNGNYNLWNCVDQTKQSPKWLFKDQNHKQFDIFAEIDRTPQNQIRSRYLLRISKLFLTSQMAEKVTPVPPNAPIKPRKFFSKEGLKPKKLLFTDKERDEIYVQKDADYSMKVFNQKADYLRQKIESKGELSKENLSAMLQDIQLETDNKENRQYEKEQYERKVKNDRFISIKKCSEDIYNSSQLLKLNYSLKGEFVHFRL